MAVLKTYVDFRTRFSTFGADIDGYKKWPLASVNQTPLALPTKVSTLTFPFTVTANAGAADSPFNTDGWHWYLSQRTDVVAKQYLSITQQASTSTQSFSGSVSIGITALGLSAWVPLGSYTADGVFRIFVDVYIYALNANTGAIYYGDFQRSLFASY